MSSNYFANTEVFDPASLKTDVEPQLTDEEMLILLGANAANSSMGTGTNNPDNGGNSTAGDGTFNADQYMNQAG